VSGEFTVKDSGQRKTYPSGLLRDVTEGKTQWHRIADGPMAARWAEHLTKGAAKYPDLPDGRPNWSLASGPEELRRFRESAFRHFMQWYLGESDEDHAAAVFFNVNGAEYVRERMKEAPVTHDGDRVELQRELAKAGPGFCLECGSSLNNERMCFECGFRGVPISEDK
jgi:hypothetical protein